MAGKSDLIYVPPNPYVKETLDFGGSEVLAGIFNVLGTYLVSLITTTTFALAFAGPIIEKIGFFAWEAIKSFKSQGSFSYKIKQVFRGGAGNLLVDIFIHDLIYASLMAYALSNDWANPVFLSFISFLFALPPAAFVKRWGGELFHHLVKKYAAFFGFKWETFYEARFILDDGNDPLQVFDEIKDMLDLANYDELIINDTYHLHHFPEFSGRTVTTRLRNVTAEKFNTFGFEIVQFLPKKRTEKFCEHNYFYSKKEKGICLLKDSSTSVLPLMIRKLVSHQTKKVSFVRRQIYDDNIRIVYDDVSSHDKKIIEIKVFNNIGKMCELMEYLMRKFNVKTTTRGKHYLCVLDKD